MGTIWVREFTGGLDTRRLPETSAGGTLMRLRDAHINRGGEIEQRAIFEKQYDLPPGETKGLASTPNGLVVFGHQSVPPSLPSGIGYVPLPHPSNAALRRVVSWELFKGAVQAIGEFENDDRYVFHDGTRITDSNAPPNLANSGSPIALLTAESKLFVASGPNLFFSAVSDSTDFGDGAGSGEGVIDMSTHAKGAEELTGLGEYDNYMVVFSESVSLIWYFDPDPNLSRRNQTLRGTGTVSPRSVTQLGDGDIIFLSESGIRSLRARDSSNSAATSDLGSPIDSIVTEFARSITDAEVRDAKGVVEPRSGRFWLAIKDRIFVFSYFRSDKVSAWSEYRPGFVVDDLIVHDRRVYLRSGDEVYIYGGSEDTFRYSEDVPAEAWLPYMDADEPYRSKSLEAIDAAVRGSWEIRVAMDPKNQSASDLVAHIDNTTFDDPEIGAEGEATHISLRFKATAPESEYKPAKISAAVIHFDRDENEDN